MSEARAGQGVERRVHVLAVECEGWAKVGRGPDVVMLVIVSAHERFREVLLNRYLNVKRMQESAKTRLCCCDREMGSCTLIK